MTPHAKLPAPMQPTLTSSPCGDRSVATVDWLRFGAWAASVLATGWCALAFAAILWPGLGTAHSDAYLPAGFAGDRAGFVVVELVPIAAVLLGALAFAGLGRRGERRAAELALA